MTTQQIFSDHDRKTLIIKYLCFVFSPALMAFATSLLGAFSSSLLSSVETLATLLVWVVGCIFFRAAWLAQGEWFDQKIKPGIIRNALRLIIILATIVVTLLSVAIISMSAVFGLLILTGNCKNGC